MKTSYLLFSVLIIFLLACACSCQPKPLVTDELPHAASEDQSSDPATPNLTATEPSTIQAEPTASTPPAQEPSSTPTTLLPVLSIRLGEANQEDGISLDQGGDVDTLVVSAGDSAVEARQTGNNQVLTSEDNNSVPDGYIQFQVADQSLFSGSPTTHVRIEVEYLDVGRDSFRIQYDALPGAGDGRFKDGGAVFKQDSGLLQTAVFNLCDANFANRDNGADFRLSDDADGPETIRQVRVIGLPAGAATYAVDDFGANPFDDQPDSAAIQSVLDQACSGSTVLFTSEPGDSTYQGYWIDQTLFLTGMSAKQDLTITASDPVRHARLRATPGLLGFVVRLYARSRFGNAGDIDNITFRAIDVDGNRAARACFGADGQFDGRNDNTGSWLPECTEYGDPWCSPGNIGMDGAFDAADLTQDYGSHPAQWTTGVVVEDLINSQTECGTSLSVGGAAFTIRNVTVDTAGDHVHAPGCTLTDPDEASGGWSDGMTITGPGHTITGNTVINPSDIGIVFFGGKNTRIIGNTIQITPGNYGAFGGIAIHSWWMGDNSGLEISGNRVVSEGDEKCGGLHTGINLGPHMWGGACVPSALPGAIGNRESCVIEPASPQGASCNGGACQIWTTITAGSSLILKDNFVAGAHINYLVEGMDFLGEFVDLNNLSENPRLSDWQASRAGCQGVRWGALDKVAHHPTMEGWTDLLIHCER